MIKPTVWRPIAIATAQLWMCACGSDSSGGPQVQVLPPTQVLPPMQAGASASASAGGGAPPGAAVAPANNGGAPAPANPQAVAGAGSEPPAATSGSGGAASGGPSLPPAGTMDAWTKGPYAVSQLDGEGPITMAGFSVAPEITGTDNPTMGHGSVLYPTDLGKDGVKHPIVAWGNGSGIQGPDTYRVITEQIASYGIVVYNSFQSNNGSELLAGIDWLIAENSRAGSRFEGKLDTTKIGVGGHSMGSMMTFAVAGDPRITTTVHASGSSGFGVRLHAPAMMLVGEDNGTTDLLAQVGDVMAPKAKNDFAASTVPTFFAEVKTLNHMSNFLFFNGAIAGWFRWQLAGDGVMKKMFVGPDCGLCTRENWVVMQKDLN